MGNWEYEIVGLRGEKDEDMIPVLEEKGNLGWELVAVVGSLREGKTYQYLAFLKRPREETLDLKVKDMEFFPH